MTRARTLIPRALPIVGLLLVAAGSPILAGPLNPPAGPVAPTYKTLTEVEPRVAVNATNTPGDADSLYRIVAPGSYYLTGDIMGVTGKSGIEIATDSVTLDLNGFTLLGTVTSLSGIAGESRTNICIKNGAVRAWNGGGVDLFGSTDCRVMDVAVEYNNNDGLSIGSGGRVDRVTARSNTYHGILCGSYGVITGCVAWQNLYGVDAGANCVARDCDASNNTAGGFWSSATAPSFENCVASANGGNGFTLSSHARVLNCSASLNDGHGISFGSESHIVGNYCSNNGVNGTGAGLYAGASVTRCRIEGNTCTSSDYGIKLDGTSNLVIGNRCSINTGNFEIVSGNRVGTVVVLPVSGAVSGNSGGSGTTDPTANLAY